jgi:hypothetical protein
MAMKQTRLLDKVVLFAYWHSAERGDSLTDGTQSILKTFNENETKGTEWENLPKTTRVCRPGSVRTVSI